MKIKNVLILMIVISFILILVGYFIQIDNFDKDKKDNIISIVYPNENKLYLDNNSILNDEEGLKINPFIFNVNIKLDKKAITSYELTLDIDNSINKENIRVYIEKSSDNMSYYPVNNIYDVRKYEYINKNKLKGKDSYGAKNSEMLLDYGEENSSITYYYKLKIWLDKDKNNNELKNKIPIKIKSYAK